MKVLIDRRVLEAMLHLARELHPREVVLLLRGEVDGDEIRVTELLLPPFASSGRGFAEFPAHALPIDFTVVGTAHSHPSGSSRPSTLDLNHFYSRVMMILAHPYRESNVAVYNSSGEVLFLGMME